jgi:hypothetical protein
VLRRLRSVLVPLAAVLLGVVLLGACASPATGEDDYELGSRVVATLVQEAANSSGTGAPSDEPHTGPVTCRHRVLGFRAGSAGTRKVESALTVDLPEGAPVRQMLAAIAAHWRDKGYDVDDSVITDDRFPKVSARVRDGYEVVATRLLAQNQLLLYAVSPCLRGD